MNKLKSQGQKGFTIVELLIVIVVIAILASITITAFGGMQQRARNTARIASARKMVNVVQMYTAVNGGDALRSNLSDGYFVCLGTDHKDIDGNGTGDCSWTEPAEASTFYISNITTVDNLLKTTGSYGPADYPVNRGYQPQTFAAPMIIDYANKDIDGRSAHLTVRFYLEGENQDCGMSTLRYLSYDSAQSKYYYTANNSNKNTGSPTGATTCDVDVSQSE